MSSLKNNLYLVEIENGQMLEDIQPMLIKLTTTLGANHFDATQKSAACLDFLYQALENGFMPSLSVWLENNYAVVQAKHGGDSWRWTFPLARDFSEEEIEALKQEVILSSRCILAAAVSDKAQLEQALRDQLQSMHQELFQNAYFDPLTQLPNRRHFLDKVEESVSLARRQKDGHFALMFIDLDGFKGVNDYYGHEAGDAVLEVVAERLRAVLRTHDFIARLGGDEFVVLLPEYSDEHGIAVVARKIIDTLETPIPLPGGEQANISASIGIAIFPRDGVTADELLRNSDISMYEVKKAGKGNFLFFNPQMREQFQEEKGYEQELSRAVEEEQFQLYYQPKVDMRTGAVVGVEALIRWFHPEKGMIPNYKWIEVLEHSPLLPQVTNWVLTRAVEQISALNDQLHTAIKVSINCDVKDFLRDDFYELITRLKPKQREELVLEVLERKAIEHLKLMEERFELIRKLGIKIAFDDFGTGNTSLSYLANLLPDELKIDRSMVMDIQRTKNIHIVRAIVGMASSLNLNVVAEGVETEEERDILLDMNCHVAQGFYYAKPMPYQALLDYVQGHAVNHQSA